MLATWSTGWVTKKSNVSDTFTDPWPPPAPWPDGGSGSVRRAMCAIPADKVHNVYMCKSVYCAGVIVPRSNTVSARIDFQTPEGVLLCAGYHWDALKSAQE